MNLRKRGVRSNLGISLLPKLLLRRCSADIAIKPLKSQVFRQIGVLLNTKRGAQTPSVDKMVDFIMNGRGKITRKRLYVNNLKHHLYFFDVFCLRN